MQLKILSLYRLPCKRFSLLHNMCGKGHTWPLHEPYSASSHVCHTLPLLVKTLQISMHGEFPQCPHILHSLHPTMSRYNSLSIAQYPLSHSITPSSKLLLVHPSTSSTLFFFITSSPSILSHNHLSSCSPHPVHLSLIMLHHPLTPLIFILPITSFTVINYPVVSPELWSDWYTTCVYMGIQYIHMHVHTRTHHFLFLHQLSCSLIIYPTPIISSACLPSLITACHPITSMIFTFQEDIFTCTVRQMEWGKQERIRDIRVFEGYHRQKREGGRDRSVSEGHHRQNGGKKGQEGV